MALDQNATYPVGTGGPSADYPEGSAVNSTAPGALDGYPFDKDGINDRLGMQQALLAGSGLTASGLPDTALLSEYVQCIIEQAMGRAAYLIEDAGSAADTYIVKEAAGNQKPRGYFDNMRVVFRAAAANTGASTVNVAGLGIIGIRDSAGVALTGGEIVIGKNALIYDAVNGWFVLDVPVAVAVPLLHIQDQKATTTIGGASIAGTQIRTLNTVLTNEVPGASLSANQITLPAGDYEIEATAPAYAVNAHRSKLYNVTGAAVLLEGASGHVGGTQTINDQARVIGRFNLASTSQVEIRHYTQTVAALGLGNATSDGATEIYTDVQIRKVG